MLRDLLQSVWRLRGLDKGQKVRFIINEEVQSVITSELGIAEGQEITYEDIVEFAVRNQARQQGRDNFKALKKELRTIPQMMLLNILLDAKVAPEKQIALYRELRSTWVQKANQRPRVVFGKAAIERDADLVIEEEKTLFEESVISIFDKCPWLNEVGFNQDELLKQGEEIIGRLRNCVPEKVISPLSDDDNTVEVEQETEIEVEVEVEFEQEAQVEKGHKTLGWCTSQKLEKYSELTDGMFGGLYYQHPCVPLDEVFKQDESLKSYASAFEGLDVVLNVLQWPNLSGMFNQPTGLGFFGPNRTPLHFVMIK